MLGAVAAVAGLVAFMAPESRGNDDEVASIYGIKIPSGYRDWKLISVADEEGKLNDLGAILGNDMAKSLAAPKSFVAGPPRNGVQFMVKDSKKYAATGGWEFAQFNDGKAADEAVHKTCFPCHEPVKAHDLVFTHLRTLIRRIKFLVDF